MKRPNLITIICFCLLLTLASFVFLLTSKGGEPVTTYSELKTLMKNGQSNKIAKVTVINGDSVIQVSMNHDDHDRPVSVPVELKAKLLEELDNCGVPIEVREPDKSGFWFSILSSFFMPLLLLIGFLFMFRAAQSKPKL
jgi:cell division protease FtsH